MPLAYPRRLAFATCGLAALGVEKGGRGSQVRSVPVVVSGHRIGFRGVIIHSTKQRNEEDEGSRTRSERLLP